jgi:hypothetical protein
MLPYNTSQQHTTAQHDTAQHEWCGCDGLPADYHTNTSHIPQLSMTQHDATNTVITILAYTYILQHDHKSGSSFTLQLLTVALSAHIKNHNYEYIQ